MAARALIAAGKSTWIRSTHDRSRFLQTPVPIPAIVFIVPVSLGIIGRQVLGSYRLIEKVFKWLALDFLAYRRPGRGSGGYQRWCTSGLTRSS
jgi:hypothetical protein